MRKNIGNAQIIAIRNLSEKFRCVCQEGLVLTGEETEFFVYGAVK